MSPTFCRIRLLRPPCLSTGLLIKYLSQFLLTQKEDVSLEKI